MSHVTKRALTKICQLMRDTFQSLGEQTHQESRSLGSRIHSDPINFEESLEMWTMKGSVNMQGK